MRKLNDVKVSAAIIAKLSMHIVDNFEQMEKGDNLERHIALTTIQDTLKLIKALCDCDLEVISEVKNSGASGQA